MLDAGLIGAHDFDWPVFCNRPAEAFAALMQDSGSLRGAASGNTLRLERRQAAR